MDTGLVISMAWVSVAGRGLGRPADTHRAGWSPRESGGWGEARVTGVANDMFLSQFG